METRAAREDGGSVVDVGPRLRDDGTMYLSRSTPGNCSCETETTLWCHVTFAGVWLCNKAMCDEAR
jgi:hypothetical protein